MPLLSVEALEFAYPGNARLGPLDFALEAGLMVGLVGPNGAGKSTLLRLLMGLLPAGAGTIQLEGKPLSEYSRRALAQRLTLVPQDTAIGYGFSVEEVVAMGRHPYLRRFQPPGAQDRAIVEEAMRSTDVAAMAQRSITALSGGERQRVLIARAIAQQTPVVLLDEATANLDLCHQLEVMELAQALARRGCLVIAAMHDLTLASRYCDRLLMLAQGRVVADGAPTDVLRPDHLRRYFAVETTVRQANDVPGLAITPLASLARALP